MVFFKDAFLCDFFFFLQISIFLQSSFTSIKNKKLLFFDFFLTFFKKNRFLPLPDWTGSNNAEIRKKRSQNRKKKKRVKVVRQPHKIKFYIDKKIYKKSFFLTFSTFFEEKNYHYNSSGASHGAAKRPREAPS